MSQAKQASKRKRRSKALPVLGATGLSLSLAGSASATGGPAADVPTTRNAAVNHEIILGDEEIHEVSLATFYVFDKENGPQLGQPLDLPRVAAAAAAAAAAATAAAGARHGGGCGGCGHGCGGMGHGCGGMGHGIALATASAAWATASAAGPAALAEAAVLAEAAIRLWRRLLWRRLLWRRLLWRLRL